MLASVILNSLYPSFFMRHALYILLNCAGTVRSHFEDVNQLIFRVQIGKNKNKTSKTKFAIISYPPNPVFTRWGSWKQKRFERAGVLVIQAKVSSNIWLS